MTARPEGKYKILRFYFNGQTRTRRKGLTLEQAQAHCNDPQTSSRTCTTPKGKRTRIMELKHERNSWFDGYADQS